MALIDLTTPRPLAEAVESLSGKTPIGAALRSADWARVPAELRETAFFSAAVESARFLQTAQDQLLDLVKLQRRRLADGGEGAFLSRARFIEELQALAQQLGVDTRRDAADTGTLADIQSEARLGMIFDIQTQRAAEYARWKVEQDADVLDAFPAQELIRLEDRRVPRKWERRWQAAGGRGYGPLQRMIARKDDPIWKTISRFGTPWPPFDFNSGMGLEDISRDEAEALGVIAPAERAEPQNIEFNQALKASVRGLSTKMKGALETIFTDQITLAGEEVRWNSQTAHEAVQSRDRKISQAVAGRAAEAFRAVRPADAGDAGRAALQGGIPPADSRAGIDRAYAAQVAASASGRKPLFHEQIYGDAAPVAAALSGKLGTGVEVRAIDGHLYAYRTDTLPVPIEEAHRLSLTGQNGELLGFGVPTMFAPGNVQVLLKNARGEIVGGFRARAATAEEFAAKRAEDYALAWNEPITAEVLR